MTARRAFVVAGAHILTTLFMAAVILRKLWIHAWRLVRFIGGVIRIAAQHFWKGIGRSAAIVFFVYALTVLGWSYGRVALGLW